MIKMELPIELHENKIMAVFITDLLIARSQKTKLVNKITYPRLLFAG